MLHIEKETDGKVVFIEQEFEINGKKLKRVTEFYDDGKPMITGNTKDAKPIGVWTHYNKQTGEPFGYQFFDFDGNKIGEEFLK